MSDKQFRILKSNGAKIVGRPQKGMRNPTEKLSFIDWLKVGFEHFESKGGKVDSMIIKDQVMVFMTRPDGKVTIRTEDEFERDYKKCYLGVNNSRPVSFEENVGVCAPARMAVA